MTAENGVLQVYAASEAEGDNINVYITNGTCVAQSMAGTVLNAIAAVAEKYDNFVRVERYTMSAAALDMSKYELLE